MEEPSTGTLPVTDLFALANAIAAMVGGPVTIEDRQSRLLAYSSQDEDVDEARRQTILGRRVPDWDMRRLEADGVFKELWSSRGVIRHEPAPETGISPRLICAIRAGDEALGSIWVAERDRPLGDEAAAALAEAAKVAALHLLRHRATADLERRHRSEVLRSLLEGRADTHDTELARLGLDVEVPVTVIAFQVRSAEPAEAGLKAQQAVDLISLYGEAFRRSAVCVALGDVVYVLLPATGEAQRAGAIKWAVGVVRQARDALRAELRCGVGAAVERISDVARSRREAEQALRVLGRGMSDDEVGDVATLNSQILLLRVEDLCAELPEMMSGKVARLRQADAAGGTAFVETLRAYLDAMGNIAQAARLVDVHENTFRYRLRKLVDVAGIDLDDPDERLALQLQMRVVRP